MYNNIIYFQTHPIQYNAPFFKKATNEGIDIEVVYLSDEGMRESFDIQFQTKIKWDIPLLEGYKYTFLNNQSLKPSINNGFWGLFNFGIIKKLRQSKKSIVILPGWNYASCWLIAFFSKIYGHKLSLRGESPLNQEILKSKSNIFLKKLILKNFLFRIVDYFLYIGKENKLFYEFYGVSPHKLYFMPYSIDNERFRLISNFSSNAINKKTELNIPNHYNVILYSGKYIAKKRPMDVLTAFNNSNIKNTILIMMGEGDERKRMEAYINKNNLQNKIILTGFINQTEITEYYKCADYFVMASGPGETWGLSVNEAMNFGLWIIVSDITGCSSDLVINDLNGWSFKYGDVEELARLFKKTENVKKNNKSLSIKIIDNYSYDSCIIALKEIQSN